MYGERLTRTFLWAGILRPPATSVMSMNLPASRVGRRAMHHWLPLGGSTVTSVGGSAAAAAPPQVRRFAGLS